MPGKRSISIVLPAYNEAQRIRQTLEELGAYFRARGQKYELIVAVDGEDGTLGIVEKLAREDPAIRAFGEGGRRGKGYGVRRGVHLAGGEIVGFVDADNKTPITEFDKFEPLLDGGYDMVIGSRAMPQSRIEHAQPLYRRWGAEGFHRLRQAIVRLDGIVDTQCGFKFFKRPAAVDLFGRQVIDGYMFDIELLYLAQHSGYRIAQVPIRWRYDGDTRLDFTRLMEDMLDVYRIRRAHSAS